MAVLSLAAFGLAACGSSDGGALCAQARECAEKAGEPFSQTECENDLKTQREKAETAGCGSEWDEYLGCADGVNFECSDNLGQKLAAECGAQAKKLNKCLD